MTTETQHPAINEELNAYLDGELDPGRRAEVEAHVGGCSECQEELESLRAARTALREQPLLRAPRPFIVPVDPTPEASWSPAPSRWRGPFTWGWRLSSLASAACILMAAISAGPGGLPSLSYGGGAASSAQMSSSRDQASKSAAESTGPQMAAQAPAAPPSAAGATRDSASAGQALGAAGASGATGGAPGTTSNQTALQAPRAAPQTAESVASSQTSGGGRADNLAPSGAPAPAPPGAQPAAAEARQAAPQARPLPSGFRWWINALILGGASIVFFILARRAS